MGGGISKKNNENESNHSITNEKVTLEKSGVRTPLQITSSHGLVTILHQSVMKKRLREFVKTSWKPTHDQDDNSFNAEARILALNFFDFLTESRDFSTIPKCGFQYFRACNIFEKYVMHGASHQIPLSTRVVDDCTQALFGGHEDQDVHLFAPAMTEATDFLMAEVYPSFEKLSLDHLERKQSIDIANVMKERAKAIIKPLKGKEILTKVISDPLYLAGFKGFCSRHGIRSHQIINCFLEMKEIENSISSLNFDDVEVNMVYFLQAIHSVYVKFFLNDIQEIGLADATKGDFLQRLSKCRTPDFEVLKPLVDNLAAILRSDYLEQFLRSHEHENIIQSGRHSVQRMVVSGIESPQCHQTLKVSHPESFNDIVPLSAQSGLEDEILQIIHSQYDVIFGQYLEFVANEKVYMHFLQSCYRYKDTLFMTDMDRIAECTSIFERYLSANAMPRVNLPHDCYRELVRQLFKPDQLIFDNAIMWIMGHFSLNRYPQFKSEVLARAEDIPKTSLSLGDRKHLGYHSVQTIIRCLVNMQPEQRIFGEGCEFVERKSQDSEDIDAATSSEEVVLTERAQLSIDCETSFKIKRGHQISTFTPFVYSSASLPGNRMDGKKYTNFLKFEDVMLHPKCCSLFKRFLDAEGTSQTILFLTEIEEFRKIPDIHFQQNRAKKIFNKYIHEKGVMPLPITSRTRENIANVVNSSEIPPQVYFDAVVEVRRYMEHNQFPRFLLSEVYLKRIEEILREQSPHQVENTMPRRTSITSSDDKLYFGTIRSLKDILSNPTCMRFYKDYCERNYSSENLFFWLDVENYANIPGSDFRKRTAIKLCKKYIDDNSKMQVNISSIARNKLISELVNPSRLIFKKAQDEIFKLMETDTLPKFLDSPEFIQMMKCIERLDGAVQINPESCLVQSFANIWLTKARSRRFSNSISS